MQLQSGFALIYPSSGQEDGADKWACTRVTLLGPCVLVSLEHDHMDGLIVGQVD